MKFSSHWSSASLFSVCVLAAFSCASDDGEAGMTGLVRPGIPSSAATTPTTAMPVDPTPVTPSAEVPTTPTPVTTQQPVDPGIGDTPSAGGGTAAGGDMPTPCGQHVLERRNCTTLCTAMWTTWDFSASRTAVRSPQGVDKLRNKCRDDVQSLWDSLLSMASR